jgi:hypothetical protein
LLICYEARGGGGREGRERERGEEGRGGERETCQIAGLRTLTRVSILSRRMAHDKEDKSNIQTNAQNQHKKRSVIQKIPPINHRQSTLVVLTAFLISLLAAGAYVRTSAGMLAAYGTANLIR